MFIGNVPVPGRAFLAPLAAYTSWPFRRICRRMGAALVVTEVVKASELARHRDATLHILEYKPDEHPISAQIMAATPEEAEGAVDVAQELGFDIIDLNCGCPKRRVLSDNLGGALMEFPERIGAILAGMVKRAKVPVTVKLRAGRWRGQPTCVEAARRAEDAGVSAVCLHPRWSEGAAVAPPDWSLIGEVKRAVKIPVIGNGAIHTAADAARMISETGCDAVMIGQAAVGRPWIFRQTMALLERGEAPPVPPQEEILAILMEHYQGLVTHHGERRGTVMMRKQSCHYAKHLRNGKAFNLAVTKCSTTEQFLAAVETYLKAPA